MRRTLSVVGCQLSVVAGLVLAGCDQQVRAPQQDRADQRVTTPAKTDQDAATQGTYYVNNWYFGTRPGDAVMGDGGKLPFRHVTSQPAGGMLNSDTNAGWSFQNNTFTITTTTGGTTPTLTGTATATGTGTQTASPVQTVSPELRARGELTTAIPIAVGMPGSIQDQQATATGRGQTNNTDKTSTPTATTYTLKAAADQLGSLVGLLSQLRNQGVSAVPTSSGGSVPIDQAIADLQKQLADVQAAMATTQASP